MSTKNTDEQLREFYVNQIKTTVEIVKQFSNTSEFSPTMLLNSLLSLVILPYEEIKRKGRGRLFSGRIIELNKKFGFSPEIFQPIQSCNGNAPVYKTRKDIYAYVGKLRNAIAHQNLRVIVGDKREIEIVIFNRFKGSKCSKCQTKGCTEKGLKYSKKGIIDFQIRITIKQLQNLALYIANSYLKSIE
ncbi:HEPN family nuclease [Senimuribacter intestinalis]|uniref:HEPN family nuclease n=1 Tax=Senimuribacter intestinalis TaxID=2941507 RepID=UPI00203D9AC4|nr:HEPN family nuclease [Senimuribacter intestinalis]